MKETQSKCPENCEYCKYSKASLLPVCVSRLISGIRKKRLRMVTGFLTFQLGMSEYRAFPNACVCVIVVWDLHPKDLFSGTGLALSDSQCLH